MGDEWPPSAPNSKQEFKKAHDAEKESVPLPAPEGIVTKQKIEELEKQCKKSQPELILTPPGMQQPNLQVEQERIERLERMKQRMKRIDVRRDFNREKGSREL